MMMFETSKHVPKTEKRCCVFENKIEFYGKGAIHNKDNIPHSLWAHIYAKKF